MRSMVVLGRNMFKGIYKADIGLDCQFVPLGQIVWSEIRRARFQRQSTGLSHLYGFESIGQQKRTPSKGMEE